MYSINTVYVHRWYNKILIQINFVTIDQIEVTLNIRHHDIWHVKTEYITKNWYSDTTVVFTPDATREINVNELFINGLYTNGWEDNYWNDLVKQVVPRVLLVFQLKTIIHLTLKKENHLLNMSLKTITDIQTPELRHSKHNMMTYNTP